MIFSSGCGNFINNNVSDDKDMQKNKSVSTYKNIRRADAAGKFYPARAERLEADIKHYLDKAAASVINSGSVRAIMAPHAGYAFSGTVAAYAYKALSGRKTGTAVIICNSHTAGFSGIALDASDTWETPLGPIELDKILGDKLIKADKLIRYNSDVHENDHTLEVQLPFLQTVLKGNFKILPVLFGHTDDSAYDKLADLLAEYLAEDDLVVISTDMSHYPAYEDAKRIDRNTLNIIKTLDIKNLAEHIRKTEAEGIPEEQTLLCGVDGVKTAMSLAGRFGWGAEILKYLNSGDAPLIGDKGQVVGYGAMIFIDESGTGESGAVVSKEKNHLNPEQKKILLGIARQSVESYVKTGVIPDFDIKDERLKRPEGAFVTLSKNGHLRGCIGVIAPASEPLWETVREMAIAAASKDNRFEPVKEDELKGIEYEISVLSVPEPIKDWRKIEMGRHGVIIKRGGKSGVFLPQVAEHFNNNREMFLESLCSEKAGLPQDAYKDGDTEILVFTAQVFGG